MSKRNAILFAAMLSLMFATVQAASVYDGALSLANVTVSPNPVQAGGNATIRFRIYNSFGFWVYDVSLRPYGSYPLLNVSPLSGYAIAQLNGSLYPTYYTYTVPVPPTTPAGTYKIFFNATYYVLGGSGTSIATSAMPVSFYVQNRPTITVTASSPQPSALYSGYNQTISLVIQNTGYGTARNVSVAAAGRQGINILSSVSSFFIANLTQGSSVTEPLLVSAQGSGSAGITTNMSYYSSNFNKRFSGSQSINLSVAPAAQFTLSQQNTRASSGSTDVPVMLSITNTGTSAAQQMQVALQSTYPITPVASSAYISDLPVGATANVTFLVSVDGQGAPGNYPVTIYEQWKQPNGAVNQQFSGSSNYFVPVVRSSGSGLLLVAAVVVIVIIGGTAVYKRRKAGTSGKKEKKK